MNRRKLLAFLGVTTAGVPVVAKARPSLPEKIKANEDYGPMSFPIGMLMPWSPYPNAVPPDNWLICDGRAVTRIHYHELFKVIGKIYGDGDGHSTFNLPDLRGKVDLGSPTYTIGRPLGNGEHEAMEVQPTIRLTHIIRAM